MKNYLFLVYTIFSATAINAFGQLAPPAQALYDSAYAQDPLMVQFALDSGAQVIATPDGNSFYLQWFPTGSIPNITPLIVTLHGSSGYAFHEFFSWFSQAKSHGCGILALQWYRPNKNTPYDYFPDDTLYSYIDSALTNINYPAGKALLHGFSRGSARSYAIIFNDIQSGKNYFCTTISNSGDADTLYPLYNAINSGVYGTSIFAGKHWNLFCGGQDTIVGCVKMANTQTWLQSQGAIVDIFIQNPALNHNGFQLQSSFMYKDSILNNYLLCFNNASSVSESSEITEINIFPNPFSSSTTIQTSNFFKDATLTVYNLLGQQLKQMDNISGQTIILPRYNLPSGMYFIHLTQDNKVITAEKLLITD